MKLVIGLGNPGKEYEKNRHNAGFMFADFLSNKEIKGAKIFKTENVFMNDSGKYVMEKVKKYLSNLSNLSDLYIVHDDLDIRLGEFKINFGKGPQVHNGILDIEKALGTKDFWRVRIGTDSRIPDGSKLGDTGHDFVLDDFTGEEIERLSKLFPKIYEELGKCLV